MQSFSRLNYRVFAVSIFFVFFVAYIFAEELKAANGSVAYTYDALGRLASEAYDTGVIIIYTYDTSGNRTQQVVNINTSTLTWTATSGTCTSNCWGGGLW